MGKLGNVAMRFNSSIARDVHGKFPIGNLRKFSTQSFRRFPEKFDSKYKLKNFRNFSGFLLKFMATSESRTSTYLNEIIIFDKNYIVLTTFPLDNKLCNTI